MRPASAEALRLVESRSPLGYFCGLCRRCGLCLSCRQGAGCGLFDKMSDGLWLRHIHSVAAFLLDDRGAGALGHRPLGVRRDHFVFGRDQVPAWLCSPCRLVDRTAERLASVTTAPPDE